MIENAYVVHYNYTRCMWDKYVRMRKNGHIYVKPTLFDGILIRIRGFLHCKSRSLLAKIRAKYF